MELENKLAKALTDIKESLHKLGDEELNALEFQWQLVSSYAKKDNASQEGLVFLITEVVSFSPTLKEEGFELILSDFSVRFKAEPSKPRKPTPTQGLPDVQNEVVDIEKKIKEIQDSKESGKNKETKQPKK